MKRCCLNCYWLVMARGLFPHMKCIKSDEMPEYIEERMQNDGRDCSYFMDSMNRPVDSGACVVNGEDAQRHFPVEDY